ERASRRIARAIVKARSAAPITRTGQLVEIVERCLPRPKPGQAHPATRSFQALRIAVNDELGELHEGLMAAERALAPGGALAVVTFHSIEDRIVKRFMQRRAGQGGRPNRFAPEVEAEAPRFEIVTKKAIGPDAAEVAANPRARSARLRVARRTTAPAGPIAAEEIGLPKVSGE
ncbi:16S rRNA (cytosine(1402)-N(4))-methyltransferase, partial [Rhodosalinus sediminis]|uniref:16S rRNA (cytosine(1402)-N(4))-methyltransferase n=1 Tax=Rhodosalinus sediminis TaxID=1940533 RepID=UPI002356E6B5